MKLIPKYQLAGKFVTDPTVGNPIYYSNGQFIDDNKNVYIVNNKTDKLSKSIYKLRYNPPSFNFLKPLSNRIANLKTAKLVGGSDPFTVEYDIPFTLQNTELPFSQKIIDTSYPSYLDKLLQTKRKGGKLIP